MAPQKYYAHKKGLNLHEIKLLNIWDKTKSSISYEKKNNFM